MASSGAAAADGGARASSPFTGRTVAVVNDLSLQEQVYLYEKARALKEAIRDGRDPSEFKVTDEDITAYLFFMEDSTRTKESFRNAAKFHSIKVNDFDCRTSSFNKKESITDTIRMLTGYSMRRSVFIIRSKLEGVCRLMERAITPFAEKAGVPPPAFLNAGDGRHEHPTQEFLDEFSFLEQLNWRREAIHLALVGDLFHGRTVHSKVDGLKVFTEVTVDLVAPDEIGMPEEYMVRMIQAGFTVRKFASIEEYLANPAQTAPIWYFTRLQLERMGEKILQKEHALRAAVTFKESFIPLVKPGTRFYHPLPRHSQYPVIPTFLDNTELNNWDRQAMNGYFTRIILLSMVCGHLGHDFSAGGVPALLSSNSVGGDGITRVASFIEEVPPVPGRPGKSEDFKVGIKRVENGIVIDHICSGQPIAEIWARIVKIQHIMQLYVVSSHGVYPSGRGSTGDGAATSYKGIISLPGQKPWSKPELKRLAAIAPGCTLNIVEQSRVVQKFRMHMPPRIYGFQDIHCQSEACVSHPVNLEHAVPEFRSTAGGTYFVCLYCEKRHEYSEIWQK
eukprot:RCo023216